MENPIDHPNALSPNNGTETPQEEEAVQPQNVVPPKTPNLGAASAFFGYATGAMWGDDDD